MPFREDLTYGFLGQCDWPHWRTLLWVSAEQEGECLWLKVETENLLGLRLPAGLLADVQVNKSKIPGNLRFTASSDITGLH
jgi:hypothetical protein